MPLNNPPILKNLSVDCLVLGFQNPYLEVLLIKFDVEPERDPWILPDANIHQDEDLDQAAARVLEERTAVKGIFMTQLSVFDSGARFPLHRLLLFTYYALMNPEPYCLNAGIKVRVVQLFRFDKRTNMKLRKSSFNFEL